MYVHKSSCHSSSPYLSLQSQCDSSTSVFGNVQYSIRHGKKERVPIRPVSDFKIRCDRANERDLCLAIIITYDSEQSFGRAWSQVARIKSDQDLQEVSSLVYGISLDDAHLVS